MDASFVTLVTKSYDPSSKERTDLTSRILEASNPRNLRTHILRLLGPKTIVYKALGLF